MYQGVVEITEEDILPSNEVVVVEFVEEQASCYKMGNVQLSIQDIITVQHHIVNSSTDSISSAARYLKDIYPHIMLRDIATTVKEIKADMNISNEDTFIYG